MDSYSYGSPLRLLGMVRKYGELKEGAGVMPFPFSE